MLFLTMFAFLAGIVTVLSPCILPLLPIILSSSDASGKQKPLGVVTGFTLSFTFFTLFLAAIVQYSGIPADSLRVFAIFVLVIFGLSLLLDPVQKQIEVLFGKVANLIPAGQNKKGFLGGVLVGISLGLLWTPCVGPILASVISLAITGTVTAQTFLITLAYALGTAIPMLMIMFAGSAALKKVPWLAKNSAKIQKGFGVVMLLTALGIFFGIDREFQTYILTTFPNYGVGLTKFEDNEKVNNELTNLGNSDNSGTFQAKPTAPELIQGGQWYNSNPLKLSDQKGKVVLVDFWTYTCINCIRTLPYLSNWWDKYHDQGLVIVGVHSPEFEFEKDASNVQKAINDFQIKYPVMQDNDFATWRAYKNRYWPAKYLIDKNGVIRYTHFGEGDYDETEKMIQLLLNEDSEVKVNESIANPKYDINSRTPELYLGSDRIQYFASPEAIKVGIQSQYSKPNSLPNNFFAYEGLWTLENEYATPASGAKLHLNFSAKEVFIVARPKNNSCLMNIKIDGRYEYLGEDSSNEGNVNVDSDRLYKIIKLDTPGQHLLLIEFLDDNCEIFAFTFG
jgi:cytochrome c biogenesis protein CcdA/thiol-disulfide isomerase/thioredoxin